MHAYVIDVEAPMAHSFYELDDLPALSNAHKKLIDALEK